MLSTPFFFFFRVRTELILARLNEFAAYSFSSNAPASSPRKLSGNKFAVIYENGGIWRGEVFPASC